MGEGSMQRQESLAFSQPMISPNIATALALKLQLLKLYIKQGQGALLTLVAMDSKIDGPKNKTFQFAILPEAVQFEKCF